VTAKAKLEGHEKWSSIRQGRTIQKEFSNWFASTSRSTIENMWIKLNKAVSRDYSGLPNKCYLERIFQWYHLLRTRKVKTFT
jgi:hypothetical protein